MSERSSSTKGSGPRKSETEFTADTGSSSESKRHLESKVDSEAEKKDEEEDVGPKYGPQHARAVLIPVSVCIWTVLIVVITVFNEDQIGTQQTREASKWNLMNESPKNSSGSNIWRAVVNGLIMLGVIIVMTCVLLLLYYYKLYKILWAFLGTSLTLGIFCETYFVGRKIFQVNDWAISYPTLFVIFVNWSMMVVLSILWKAPRRIQQVSMIYLSCSMSLLLQLLLPHWTGWCVLALLVIWDLVAVLAPCGPLKKFVELAQERGEKHTGPLTALVYTSGMAYFGNLKDHRLASSQESSPDQEETERQEQSEEEEELHGIQLGIGDFVFYSILTGKVAETGYWTTVIACYIALISGLLTTLFFLVVKKKPLPALPISLTCGIAFYFGGEYALIPYLDGVQRYQVLM